MHTLPATQKSVSQPPAFAVHWSRLWAAFMLGGFSIISGLCVLMAVAAWPTRLFLFFFMCGFSLLMLAGAKRGLQLLLNPTLMFEVTPHGITTYFREDGYQTEGFFVPWQQIQSMEFMRRISPGGGSGRIRTIAVHVNTPEGIDSAWSVGGGHDPHVLHLDATTGTMRGRVLLEQLLRAYDFFAPSGQDTGERTEA